MGRSSRSFRGIRPRRQRPLRYEPLERRTMLAGDVLVQFQFVDDASKTPLDTLQVGDAVELQVYIQDIRETPGGLFQAYFDVDFNPTLVSVTGSIGHGTQYVVSTSGKTSFDDAGIRDGLMDQAGGLTSGTPNPLGGAFLLFTVPMHVDAVGTLVLTPTYDEDSTRRVEYFDTLDKVPFESIDFVGTSIEVAAAGIQVTPTSGLTTSESGGAASFEVKLSKAPTAPVTIGLSSSDTSEGTVSPSSLTFDDTNWNTAQTVTVTGVDDPFADGDAAFTIVTAAAVSGDPEYSGVNAADVSVTNLDDDTPGFAITQTDGDTQVSESGTTDIFGVALTAQPQSNVVILVSSDDTGEATVDKASLTFTPGNWNLPQTVTVTGQDDQLDDGDRTATITLSVDDANSDNQFDPLSDQVVSVDVLDDDEAGFTVTETGDDTRVSETGTTDGFTVALTAEPASNVVISVSSGDTGEATVDKASLTFTPTNWNVPQTVTVTGQDDPQVDGTQTTTITLSIDDDASDDGFDPLPDQTIFVSTTSNDLAGYTFVETDGDTEVSETGTTDTFTVVLSAQPVSDVVISVSSGDTGEAAVDKSSLTFTPANWDIPQTVTVTGQDDPAVDGTQTTTITLSVDDAASDDLFDPLAPRAVTVTTTDDDTAGFTVSESGGGTQVSESGTSDSFTVVLDAQPVSNVVILVASDDTGEATVDKASLTFTPANWNVLQTVTVTGEDDPDVDGTQTTTITLSIDDANSDDAFDPLADQTVSVTTADNDVPGITVIAAPGLSTTEGGGTATFRIVLDKQPAADVTIGLTSDDTTEGTVSVASVTFTPADWNQPQTVTATGVDDFLVDGDRTYLVVTAAAESEDPDYDGLEADDVELVNTDDDEAGIAVIQTGGSTQVSEIGTTDTFTVTLTAEPESDVVILVASADVEEATVDKSSLTFTPANWNVPQTVTVTGEDDDALDGTQTTDITLSIDDANSDDVFDAVENEVISVATDDDDVPGFVVSETGSVTEVSESGTTDTLTVVLTVEPASDVVIRLTADDPTEAALDKTALTFTPADWNVPQTVTVSGEDDSLVDGARSSTITLSVDAAASDDAFDAVDDQTVAVTTMDDDVAGFTVTETDGRTLVSESGTTDSFEIVLTAEPGSDVVIRLTADDPTEAALDKTVLTFTPADWNVPQTVTVTGEDDDLLDGEQTSTVTLSIDVAASDDAFDGVEDQTVAVTTTDDDTPGFTVTQTDGQTLVSESGTTDTVDVVLNAQPASDVVILVLLDADGEATVDKTVLTFSPADWNVPQTVTVTGLDDHVLDGDQAGTLTLSIDAAASDDDFDALDDQTVTVTTSDDDVAGFTITETDGGTEVSEAGSTDTFSVQLTVRPDSDVVVLLSGGNPSEVAVDKTSLTFTPDDWNVPQVVTLTGLDDEVVDGDKVSHLTLSVDAANSDPAFDSVADQSLAAVNTDNDSATLTIFAVSASLDEGGAGTTGTLTFEVTLSGEVEGGFTVAYATNDGTATEADGDYVAADSTLAFTGGDGESMTITIVVNGDDTLEPDEQLTVALGALSGIDPSAAENVQLSGSPVAAIIANDDTATLTVTGVSQVEGSGGGTTGLAFNVTLSGAVQGGFHVAYQTADGEATVADGDYTAGDGTVEFAGTAGEVQTIVVQVARDAKVERDETLTVALGGLSDLLDPAMAADLAVDTTPAVGTIENDDTAAVSFASASSSGIEAAGEQTILVKLSVAGGGTLGEAVTVNVVDLLTGTAQTPADYALATTSVTFDAGSADGATKQVTVTTVDDGVMETGETVNLKLELAADGIAGAVTVATPDEHILTIIDDPQTAGVSGSVWADTNDDGVFDAGEAGLPGVTITLTGEDSQGRSIEIVTMTDAAGEYQFMNLPGGTYEIRQTQPLAFHDGREWLGTVEGAASGQVGEDRFTGVALGPGEQAEGYNFGEWGLKARYVSRRMLRASSPPAQESIREAIAQAEELEGDADRAQAIRQGKAVEVRRIDSEVIVTGSSGRDSFSFVPADSVDSADATKHTITANGLTWTFDADKVSKIVLDGGGGADEVELNDSAGDDLLEAAGDTATLSNANFRLDAIAFELVKALSHSGGDDEADEDAIDFVLQFEGPWDQIN